MPFIKKFGKPFKDLKVCVGGTKDENGNCINHKNRSIKEFAKSKEMSVVLEEAPFLGDIIESGDLGRFALEYMNSQMPNIVPAEAGVILKKIAEGRITAFKHWLEESWSGDTKLTYIVGDYLDYLSLFKNDSQAKRLTLREYFDATRAPEDRGDFEQYAEIMN